MRAALFLPSSHAAMPRARRRFVQDGEVPVVMAARGARPDERSHVAQLQQVVAQLQKSLDTEREARMAAERNLLKAEELNRQLQTRLAHDEIALREYQREAKLQAQAQASAAVAQPASSEAAQPKKRGRKPMIRPMIGAASAIPMQTEESRLPAAPVTDGHAPAMRHDAPQPGADQPDDLGEGFVEWWKPDWQQAFR